MHQFLHPHLASQADTKVPMKKVKSQQRRWPLFFWSFQIEEIRIWSLCLPPVVHWNCLPNVCCQRLPNSNYWEVRAGGFLLNSSRGDYSLLFTILNQLVALLNLWDNILSIPSILLTCHRKPSSPQLTAIPIISDCFDFFWVSLEFSLVKLILCQCCYVFQVPNLCNLGTTCE